MEQIVLIVWAIASLFSPDAGHTPDAQQADDTVHKIGEEVRVGNLTYEVVEEPGILGKTIQSSMYEDQVAEGRWLNLYVSITNHSDLSLDTGIVLVDEQGNGYEYDQKGSQANGEYMMYTYGGEIGPRDVIKPGVAYDVPKKEATYYVKLFDENRETYKLVQLGTY